MRPPRRPTTLSASSLLALLAACHGAEEPGDCGGAALVDALSVTVSESLPTVATLDLAVDGPADVTVTLEADGAPTVETTTWTDLDGDASLPLYGMRPDTTYTARVEAVAPGACQTEEIAVTTGSLPASLAEPVVVVPGEAWGNWTLVSWIDNEDPGNTGALILDREGVVVWYWDMRAGAVSPNVTWDADSNELLARGDDFSSPETTTIYRIAMTGETVSETVVPYAHHELGQAPDIDFAVLQAVSQEADGELVAGDQIVEVAADGTQRVVWNAFDCMGTPEHHGAWDADTAPVEGRDWTHANGLTWCEEDDSWLVSFYWLNEVRRLRRGGCEEVWELDGDDGGDFTLGEDAVFGPQHGPACTPDGVVLLDNHRFGGDETRALALDLDTDAMTADVRWSVQHPEQASTPLLGATVPLPDGSTVVGWGGIGDVGVVSADGELVWQVTLGNAIVGGVDRRESLYGP
ncbi:MAG: aryl-sulfate sulfotransferase [Myxococcota bacterium]